MKVDNGVAIVTGGNRGIGEAFVREFLGAGAHKVYIGTRELSGPGHLIDEFGDQVESIQLDVTSDAQIKEAAAYCDDVNILVNNAGAFLHLTLIGAPDLRAAREEMEVNYFGALSMCRYFAPVLEKNGGGAIVNVLSAGAIISAPNMGGYSPSKFAARAMTTNVRAELEGQDTQVSALIVGSVDTRMASHVKGFKEPASTIARAGIKAIEKNIPEMDTDPMAVGMRAALARDPAAMEKQMAALLKSSVISTGR